jgi:hypothetical protein
MSEDQHETSLIEPAPDQDAGAAPRPDPPADEDLVADLEEQERGGWMNEPTTG